MTLSVVKRYLIAFDQYKWVGLATLAVTVGVSGVVAVQPNQAPVYVAKGTLAYSKPTVIFSSTTTKIQQEGQEITKDKLLNQQVIQAAAKKLIKAENKLNKQAAELNSEELNEKVKILTKKLKDGVEIKMPTKSNDPSALIQVSYKNADRQKAEKRAEALMNEMVIYSENSNNFSVRKTIAQINQRLPKVTQELREVEAKLESYEKREETSILAVQSGTLPQAIIATEQQQRQLRVQLGAIVAQIKSLQERLGLNGEQAYVAQALSADPIIAQLRVQLFSIESQLKILRSDLQEEHPKIVELLKQKQAFEQQLQQRQSEVLGGNGVAAPLRSADRIRIDSSLDPARQQLAQSLIALQTQRDVVQEQLKGVENTERQLRQEYAKIPNKQLEQARLAQQVALKKALYDKMQAALVDAEAARAETTGSLTVAQPPKIDDVPPNKKGLPVMLAVGGFVGLLLGGGFIFLLGMLNGKFYSWEEVRAALVEKEVPILAVLPEVIVFDSYGEEMPLALEPNSPYLEFYERLRTNLRRIGEKPVKVVLLTSAAPLEGKSFSAYNLAIASARSGKRTLLIEADLRSGSNVESLKIAADPLAAVEPLHYYGNMSECVLLVPEVENLYVVPSPGSLRQASAVLESSEMRRLFEDVRNRFDFVVVDSPALSECNDALTLEPYTDGIILVARAGYTLASMLSEAADQLVESDDEDSHKSGPRLLGAIINGADIAVKYRNDIDEFELPLSAVSDGAIEVRSRQLPQQSKSKNKAINSKFN
ncbi:MULTISPECIES: tyrosine-protein kinase domain-containing protein [unclassified Microcoleus]|uniref:GumC family protein n=1 Tax=unclassified Microcoleus TaxID=2642155 RepID=UPI001DCAD59B|nr:MULTISPECIES: tyrosine-protein kinase domain-containing protein [unclassified Microcoleus]MCC3465727.1 AAA family ATPase [Microcoleus sp. PH2017_06_SFM_O_A]TAG96644.1 MAG: lipopolysaccharide biosynthesis [Oscillatoriales cyanobacterium]MCC3524419.1 AAA family ATPase [Microcoleus sp. PH2017_20_SFW_D_A]MCC3555162.1 AAA family ATPase [Microcoleus sp. PH2017_35_SFW_U_B]MCC3570529.1 AAA family ATPase [Microcoleus sp. PH2017_34_RAT_O_A]